MAAGQVPLIQAPVLVLVGPTAIGKTSLSLDLASRFNCEIVSVDSMQVYRFMDIGTAKPGPEERHRVPHHLIDIVDPDEQYDAARFVDDALAAIASITSRGAIPLLTGGTGLYLRALTRGLFAVDKTDGEAAIRDRLRRRLAEEGRDILYRELVGVDPVSAARLHPNDSQRLLRALEIYHATGVPWSVHLQDPPQPPVRFARLLQFGLRCPRPELYQRIEERTDQMLAGGLLAEVAKLREMGYDSGLPSMQAIGYRHAGLCLDGEWDLAETRRILVRDTRRYAKRQFTWFTAIPDLHWFERRATAEVLAVVETWLAGTAGN